MGKNDINHLISLIFSLGRLIRKRLRPEKEFSLLQIITLRYIKDHKNISMKDIASFLHITPPSATSLINELVKNGKLKRIRDKQDRRLIYITITTSGEKILNNFFKKTEKEIQNIFSKLQPTEIETLIHILEKIYTNNPTKSDKQ